MFWFFLKYKVPNKLRKPQSSAQVPDKEKTGRQRNIALSTAKPVKTGAKKRPISARIDSGLRSQTASKGEERDGVEGRHNKENITQTKKLSVSWLKSLHSSSVAIL